MPRQNLTFFLLSPKKVTSVNSNVPWNLKLHFDIQDFIFFNRNMPKTRKLFFIVITACITIAAQKGYILPQLGHAGTINALAFSGDGRFIFSSSEDNTIIMWDAATLDQLNIFGGHGKAVVSFNVADGNKRIISRSEDNSFSVWDWLTGEQLLNAEIPGGYKSDMFLDKSESVLLFVTPDSKLFTCDLEEDDSPVERGTLPVADIAAINFQKDVEIFAVADPSGEVFLINGEDLSVLGKMFQSSKNSFHELIFSPDGKYLAGITDDSVIYVWNVSNKSIVFSTRGETGLPPRVAFFNNSNFFVYFLSDIKISGYDLVNKSEVFSHKPMGDITALAISGDDKRLAVAYFDNTIVQFEIPTQKVINSHEPVVEKVTQIKFSADNSILLMATNNSSFHIWNKFSGEPRKYLQTWDGLISAMDISPSGTHFAYGTLDETIRIYNTSDATEITTISGKPGTFINVIKWSKTDRQLAAESENHTIKFWDIMDGSRLKTFSGPQKSIGTISVSDDGKLMAAGGVEGNIYLWDINSESLIKKFGDFNSPVTGISFIKKGKELVSTSGNGDLNFFNTENFSKKAGRLSYQNSSSLVAFSPSGEYVAVSSENTNYFFIQKVFDTLAPRMVDIAFGPIDALEFSGNSKLLLASSADRGLYILDAASGSQLGTLYFFGSGDWAFIAANGEFEASEGGLDFLKFIDNNRSFPVDKTVNSKYKEGLLSSILF